MEQCRLVLRTTYMLSHKHACGLEIIFKYHAMLSRTCGDTNRAVFTAGKVQPEKKGCMVNLSSIVGQVSRKVEGAQTYGRTAEPALVLKGSATAQLHFAEVRVAH